MASGAASCVATGTAPSSPDLGAAPKEGLLRGTATCVSELDNLKKVLVQSWVEFLAKCNRAHLIKNCQYHVLVVKFSRVESVRMDVQ